jgi:hypothetical protein
MAYTIAHADAAQPAHASEREGTVWTPTNRFHTRPMVRNRVARESVR